LSIPKDGGEAREDFCFSCLSKLDEKRVELDFDLAKETLVTVPAAIALGTG
jgi:hypothetical protein